MMKAQSVNRFLRGSKQRKRATYFLFILVITFSHLGVVSFAADPFSNNRSHHVNTNTSEKNSASPTYETQASVERLEGVPCADSFSLLPTLGWDHFRSTFIAANGRPNHNGHDIVALPYDSASQWIAGKFTYGPLDKDMENELVEVFLNDERCSGWKFITSGFLDGDGRFRTAIGPPFLPGGPYAVKMVLPGDNSSADYFLHIWPAGTRVVVFDIDGTLTTADFELVFELFDDLYTGDYIPEMRFSADRILSTFYDKNYRIIYLTGRPYWLHKKTREWLSAQNVAGGIVHLTDSNRDSYPSNARVGEYKAAYLQSLLSLGMVIDWVYGNARTDIYAYQKAGIAKDSTFIIGEYAGEGGTCPIGSYLEHLEWVQTLPEVIQP